MLGWGWGGGWRWFAEQMSQKPIRQNAPARLQLEFVPKCFLLYSWGQASFPMWHPGVHSFASCFCSKCLNLFLWSAFLSNLRILFAFKPLAVKRSLSMSEKWLGDKSCVLERSPGNNNNNKKVRLTLVLTQAELLTEILGHYTRARTVTRMVWMVTWLVVVHLIGRVIWIKSRESSDIKGALRLGAVESIFRTMFLWWTYLF